MAKNKSTKTEENVEASIYGSDETENIEAPVEELEPIEIPTIVENPVTVPTIEPMNEPKISTGALIRSRRFSRYQQDFLKVLLKEPAYTLKEAQAILDDYYAKSEKEGEN